MQTLKNLWRRFDAKADAITDRIAVVLVVAWLAYGQLTASPMRQAKQCPGCLSRHHGADRYCPPCEVKRQLVELAIAAVVIGLAFGLDYSKDCKVEAAPAAQRLTGVCELIECAPGVSFKAGW